MNNSVAAEFPQPSRFCNLKRRLTRIFAERDIILSSNGRARSFRLSAKIQITALLAMLVMVLCVLTLSISYLKRHNQVADAENALKYANSAYLDLLGEVADYQDQFLALTRTLEENRTYLLGALDRNKQLRKERAALKSKFESIHGDAARVALARGEMQKRLESFQTELGVASDRARVLEADIERLHSRLALSENDRVRAIEARESLRQRISELEGELALTKKALETKGQSFAALEKDLTQSKRAYDRLLAKQNIINTKLSKKQEDVESLIKSRASLQANLNKALEDNTSLTEKHTDLTLRYKKTLSQLDVATQELAQSQKHATEITLALDRARMGIAHSLGQQSKLSKEHSSALQVIENMNQQIEDLQGYYRVFIDSVRENVQDRIDRTVSAVKRAGLDIEGALDKIEDTSQPVGGPMIVSVENLKLPRDDEEAILALDSAMQRWNNIDHLFATMPLSAPMQEYRISSGFGKRIDPFTKNPAMHYGLDMKAPFKSRVYSPAAGRVVFAGWKGSYGRMIEIDHGLGIRTRYGHLYKILVKRGQSVAFSDPIGLIGSSGRSTGPHLHYEINQGRRALDPIKIMKVSSHVFKKGKN